MTHKIFHHRTAGEQMLVRRAIAIETGKPDDVVIQAAIVEVTAIREGTSDLLSAEVFKMMELN